MDALYIIQMKENQRWRSLSRRGIDRERALELIAAYRSCDEMENVEIRYRLRPIPHPGGLVE